MTNVQQRHWARSTAIAERDQLRPFLCTRRDTGELIWLVQSRSDPSHYYLLIVREETIHCPCPQAQRQGICAHAAAVHLVLQAEQQPQKRSTAPQASNQNSRAASRQEQE